LCLLPGNEPYSIELIQARTNKEVDMSRDRWNIYHSLEDGDEE